jgi:DNA-binding PadR family transcriptional regulator
MERLAWIEAEWGVADSGRKARIYRLTPAGRRQLRNELARFSAFVNAVRPILLTE